jgi:hypothetical protein
MKHLIIFIMVLTFFSCKKEEFTPNPPNPPVDIITDSTLVDSTTTFKGETWVITQVLNTNFSQEFRSDTLVFLTENSYTFNGSNSIYHLYTNSFGYTLTLNNTVWGHISGTVYDYNLTEGIIDNCQFKNYFTNENSVRIWMYRI